MSDKEEVEFLQSSRSRIRAKATRACNAVEQNLTEWSLKEVRMNSDELRTTRSKLEKLNEDILRFVFKQKIAGTLEKEYEKVDEYDDKIALALSTLEEHQKVNTAETSMLSSTIQTGTNRSGQLKLPQLPLPEYGHKEGECLETFITNFETILFKYDLSSYERYVYLERQVKGEALLLIKSLYGEEQSYEEAKQLLLKAFASPTTQKFDTLEKLASLNLQNNGSCYVFVSEMRTVIHSIKSLKISIEDILQFFIWRAMPFALQSQLINITNNNKPTVLEVEEHIFSAIDRYKSNQQRKNEGKPVTEKRAESATHFAASVNFKDGSKFKPCVLCSSNDKSSDHSTSKCTKYCDARAKINKLKQMNSCVKCGYNNHQSADCRFRFNKNCFHCGGSHFSFLCPNEDKPKNLSASNMVKVSTGTISIEATTLNFQSNYPTLLPTFTAPLSCGGTIHSIKDSGAQCTLILSKFANENKLKTIENVDIKINGFNSSKPYATKIVEVPLIIGNANVILNAVCVPDINIELKIEGLDKLVTKFVSEGFSLADKSLLDYNENEIIGDIELILGANYAYLLNESSAFSPLKLNVIAM